MQTIYKYPMEVVDEQSIMMPVGAQILTVQVQGGWPYLWALVDLHATLQPRKILTYSTGHVVPYRDSSREPAKYVGTYQLENGALVFHVFEESRV